MNILIEDVLIVPMTGDGEPVFGGSIGITGGRIAMVSDDPDDIAGFRRNNAAGLKVIDGRGKLAMPGLINTHNHASMSLMRSYADDIPLMEWLNGYIWPMERRLTRDTIILGARLAIAEMLLSGTTTFVDMYWQEEAVGDAVIETGIRAVLAPTMIDFKSDDFERDVAAVAEKFGKGQHSRITMQVAAHSPYSVSVDNLRRVLELSDKFGAPVNIHLAETLDESAQIRERYGRTPVGFADSLGLLRPGTLINHGVQLSDDDIAILSRTGTAVAHCPQSNMKLGNGAARVVEMLDAGICVSIATDGPCSNNDLDMWEELRTASFLQKNATRNVLSIPAHTALEMATVHGARAIGKGDSLGRIKEGFTADIILMDIRKPHLYPPKDMIANLVYSGKGSDVDTVIVDGNVLVENRRLLTIDLDALLSDVERNMF